MSRRFHLLFLFLGLLLASTAARAQSVRWEPSGGTLAVGQATELSLIFADCEPVGDVTLPPIDGVTLSRPSRGEQSSFNIVNGQASRSRTVYLTYTALPIVRAPIEIPAFDVQTDKGVQRVAGVRFQVGDATVGGAGSSMPLDSAANSRIAVGEGTAWAGQVLPITYTLSVTNRFPANIGSNPDWNAAPLVLEEWSKPEPFNSVVSGEARNNILYKSRGYIREPGTYTLDAVNQLVNLRVPSAGFSIFQSFQAEQFNITSNRPSVVVRPLPQPAPGGFAGAVGDFTLTSRVVPGTATVSEPITWTLELAGTGNWPDIAGLPGREASRDFRVVQPQAKRTPAEGALFEATLSEDVVLIPTKPGSYTLGPVVWTYFDPIDGTYKTLTTERVTVTVTPAVPTDPDGAPPVATTTPANGDRTAEAPALRPPEPPAAIPLDPMPGRGSVPVPWSRNGLAGALVASVAWLPLLWLGLALRRARRNDPFRARREARLRLAHTLRALGNARDPGQARALVQQWQRDTAVLWGVSRAAPTAQAFGRAEAWSHLWTESERFLYGPAEALPAHWIIQADAALSAQRVPAFSPAAVFLPRNLLPFVATLVFLAAPVPTGAAEPGTAAYGRSEFAVAEKIWRETLARRPTDWIAHHNLALALAQQDRWNEAAGHALAAFVQNPAHPSVRWHFGLTLERAGYAPPALTAFVRPGPLHKVARLFSPARWERLLVGAGFLLAVGAGLWLMRGYGNRSRWLPPLAGTALAAALLIAVTALLSLRLYGQATDARTALVWHATTLRSIPTEADTAQKTSPLSAGSLAVIDRRFLGWLRLAFPDGQTGWVRDEDVVRLYR